MKMVQEKNIHFEICPYSSLQRRAVDPELPLPQHPLKQLFDRGVSVSINTSDPVVTRKDIKHEYLLAYEQMGLTLDEITNTIRMASHSCDDVNIYVGKLSHYC